MVVATSESDTPYLAIDPAPKEYETFPDALSDDRRPFPTEGSQR